MEDQKGFKAESGESRADGNSPEWDQRLLLWNLYLTQGILLVLGFGLLWMQGRLQIDLFGFGPWHGWWLGVGVGLAVVGVEWLLSRVVPAEWLDDGGINRLLFNRLSLPHIFGISALAAVAEEVLFRGALQHGLGVVGATLLFAAIHFRYWKKWMLMTMLVAVSLLLGGMVEVTGVLAPAISCHFTVDFVMGMMIRKGRMV
ncbi:CPBP family intramembrane glutamic endopeptidase [Paludifilum halophilum]|uniref:CAAX prenyl protease 2/Lysostaphin resistance protein A-like domain-containing protein n=1 Tax=Paludifilum halophilum TaxID=1642702 RepID=A0A235BBU0_9BACL|nr:CPBP family intramembrane glutamic endopeptidase [Paludifilum halophilum]OYD09746.1 hypothetical protein CHM34_01765 [Paludifilum halophilum]